MVAASGRAQDASAFYPLNDGDTWTFERLEHYPSSADRFAGYRRVTVVSDTTVGGAPYKTARVEYLRFSQEVESTAHCVVRVVGGGAPRVEWASVRGTCGAPESGLTFESEPAMATYHVGGLPYESLTRVSNWNTYPYPTVLIAENVGLVATTGISGGGFFPETLLHATVGGVSYGEMPGPQAWRAFQPLGVGDRWAFQLDDRLPGSPQVRRTYETLDATGEVTVNGLLYYRVVRKTYDAAYAITVTTAQLWRHDDR
ncbi:MAG TPA: hypothetical protein VF576_13810, partial [Rubricoccaceae bacterium]